MLPAGRQFEWFVWHALEQPVAHSSALLGVGGAGWIRPDIGKSGLKAPFMGCRCVARRLHRRASQYKITSAFVRVPFLTIEELSDEPHPHPLPPVRR